jgi:thiamine-phosphate pyrophosphorylase
MLTDPKRTPHPVRLAKSLPRGMGVIYRPFGAPKAPRTAEKLRRAAQDRGLILLIGSNDPKVRGAGAHLPERMAGQARRFRRPGVLVTAAAHSEPAIRRARLAGCDAVLVSTVFKSRSASAGRPMGAIRFAVLVRRAGLPVYALGGINAETAPRLLGSGAAGLAAVGAFTD